MTTRARIIGKVEYREGDGANITIRPGPCEVKLTAQDATVSWTDGETRGSASMPIANFKAYVESRAIELEGAAPVRTAA